MLIKVGRFYLTLGTFSVRQAEHHAELIIHGASDMASNLTGNEASELLRILDDHIAKQATLQQQIDAVNKQSADFAAKMEQFAAYEQHLMQKAAQVEQAHAALNNKVVSVGAMPAFPGNGGRKR